MNLPGAWGDQWAGGSAALPNHWSTFGQGGHHVQAQDDRDGCTVGPHDRGDRRGDGAGWFGRCAADRRYRADVDGRRPSGSTGADALVFDPIAATIAFTIGFMWKLS